MLNVVRHIACIYHELLNLRATLFEYILDKHLEISLAQFEVKGVLAIAKMHLDWHELFRGELFFDELATRAQLL